MRLFNRKRKVERRRPENAEVRAQLEAAHKERTRLLAEEAARQTDENEGRILRLLEVQARLFRRE